MTDQTKTRVLRSVAKTLLAIEADNMGVKLDLTRVTDADLSNIGGDMLDAVATWVEVIEERAT
jgi:hypothetical protein